MTTPLLGRTEKISLDGALVPVAASNPSSSAAASASSFVKRAAASLATANSNLVSQQQQQPEEMSPMLPPNTFRVFLLESIKSIELLAHFLFSRQATPGLSAAVASGCPVAAVTAAGSNLYLRQPQRPPPPRAAELAAVAVPIHATGWTTADGQPTELCPYATFALPASATTGTSLDDTAATTTAVTLKLHPHAEVFGTLCRYCVFLAFIFFSKLLNTSVGEFTDCVNFQLMQSPNISGLTKPT